MANFSQILLRLESLLEAEAKLLMAGALQDLPQIDDAKNRIWSILLEIRDSGNASDLSRIQKMAAHNAKLLIAAKEGVALARKLRRALNSGYNPLSTYGANGQKSTVANARRSQLNSRSF